MHPIIKAFNATTCEELLKIFPKEWEAVAARIIESGVELSDQPVKWAPRWSKISPTVKSGPDALSIATKSVIYRVHDCIHQLWGLPHPDADFTEEARYLYKRAQLCGEVAVLTLTEFVFCKYLYDTYPEIQPLINSRNAVPLLSTVFSGLSTKEIAARLDGVLHKNVHPKWLRDNEIASKFAADYVPMLEFDRTESDKNWSAMKAANWIPVGAPNSRYSQTTDGLELTLWMIDDFYHQMRTDHRTDEALVWFNRKRRETIILPIGW